MESLFPFLVMIAYAVISWYVKKKQSEKDTQRTSPPPSEQGKEWDELLEALGQKPSEKPPEPVAPVRSAPPVIVQRSPEPVVMKPQVPSTPPQLVVVPKTVFTKIQAFDPEKLVDEEMKSLEEDLKGLSTSLKIQAPQTTTTSTITSTGYFSSHVKNKKSLRDAIVLNEVLQPPLALRPLS